MTKPLRMQVIKTDTEADILCRAERNMLYAMLTRSMIDFLGIACGQRDMLGAVEWILNDSLVPFSYEWVCEILDIDSNKIRGALMKMSILPKHMLQTNASFNVDKRLGMLMKKANRKKGQRGATQIIESLAPQSQTYLGGGA